MNTPKIYLPIRNRALKFVVVLALTASIFFLMYALIFIETMDGQRLGAIIGIVVLLPLTFYIFYSSRKLKYVLSSDYLIITEGLFINRKIPVKDIRKIAEVYSVMNTPAATSYDRLEIFYNTYDSIMISPKDREGFINNILTLNNKVEIQRKTKGQVAD